MGPSFLGGTVQLKRSYTGVLEMCGSLAKQESGYWIYDCLGSIAAPRLDTEMWRLPQLSPHAAEETPITVQTLGSHCQHWITRATV
jgi:hypothetical protein